MKSSRKYVSHIYALMLIFWRYTARERFYFQAAPVARNIPNGQTIINSRRENYEITRWRQWRSRSTAGRSKIINRD